MQHPLILLSCLFSSSEREGMQLLIAAEVKSVFGVCLNNRWGGLGGQDQDSLSSA